MNHVKFASFSAVIAVIFSSCSVYYTTSQVDNSLKTSINQANSSIGNLEYQVSLMESKYNDIHCDQKPESLKKADQMFQEVKADMSQVNKQKAELNQEYTNFQKYTQGKDKIVSGTPEFNQLKVTRNNMKMQMENLQNKCNQVVAKSQNVANHITQNVVPSIQQIQVESYNKSFETSIKDIENGIVTIKGTLNNNKKELQEFVITSGNNIGNNPQIEKNLVSMDENLSKIEQLKSNLQTTYNTFKTATAGKRTINSCSKEWTIVTETEQKINGYKAELDGLVNSIKTNMSQIQSLLKK